MWDADVDASTIRKAARVCLCSSLDLKKYVCVKTLTSAGMMMRDTYIHVFNIHLRLLLQLRNNVSVEPLELQSKNTSYSVQRLVHHPTCISF